MNELVSIVIPAHNVERYINRCIKSILNQSYSNIEIIIVEDSSTDKTGAICDNYSINNSNIIVKHVKNKSAGKSRNEGIELAKGKYIIFVDSDDYLENDMVENLLKVISNNGVSAVFCGYNEIGAKKNIIFKYGEKIHIYDKEQIRNKLIYNVIYVEDREKELPLYSVWAGIYDLDIIKKEKIRFLNEDKCYSEDSIFNFEFLCKASKAITINAQLYNYNIKNENSICNNYNKRFNYLEKWKELIIELAKKNGIYSNVLNSKIDKMYLDCTIINIKQEILATNNSLADKKKELLKIINQPSIIKMLKNKENFKGKSRNKKIILYMMKYKLINLIYFLVILRSKYEK